MPLQREIYKIAGKLNGNSYYYSKNGGYQFRSINPNMSELVKNDPRFALTREYSYSFKRAANMAGSLISAVDSRWRFMFRKNIHAALTKRFDDLFRQITGLDGSSGNTVSVFQPFFMDAFNKLGKISAPSFVTSWARNSVGFNFTENRAYINTALNFPQIEMQYYLEQGVTNFQIEMYALKTSLNSQIKYEATISPTSIIGGTANMKSDADVVWLPASTPANNISCETSSEDLFGLLLIIEPYRMIAGKKYIIQRLCSAFYFRPSIQV